MGGRRSRRRSRRTDTVATSFSALRGMAFDDEVPPNLGVPEGKLVERAPDTLDGEAVVSMARKVDDLELESQRHHRSWRVWPVTLALSLVIILLLVVYSLVA